MERKKEIDLVKLLLDTTKFTYDVKSRSLVYNDSFAATILHVKDEINMLTGNITNDTRCKDILALMGLRLAREGEREPVSLEKKWRFNKVEKWLYDAPTVEYIQSLPSYDVILNYLRQLLTGKVEKEILVVIGASNTGKSTMLEKVFKNALTVSDGVETAKYYVMSRAGKFATSGSHLANLTIVDDTTDTLGGKWLTEFIKTITDETRIVEYKGINAVECETPMGAIFNLNGAFYIKKMSEIACMNRFMIIDFTKIYNADRSFKDSLVIDRDTLISMALAQETYVEPIHNKEYKKKWLNWLDFWRGTGEHLIPSVEWVLNENNTYDIK